MKTKNKTAGFFENPGGYKNMNQKLSVIKYNTPFEIEQKTLPNTTGVYLNNSENQAQCLYCRQWFDYLPCAAIYANGTLRGIFVELCGSCGDLAAARGGPANEAQRNFWLTVKTNLAEIAEVDSEIISEVKR